MGTKLCNLNVYNPENKEYSLDSGYSIIHIVDNWDTIIEKEPANNFNKIAKVARDISKEIDAPVITATYFDDDIFELSVTVDGKKSAYYTVTHGRTISKKIPNLVAALDLCDRDAKAFRYLAKKDMNAPEAITKISAICNLPLYVDATIYKEMPGEIIPDKDSVLEEIEKEKKKNKDKANKAELLYEFSGDVIFHPVEIYNYDAQILKTVEPDDDVLDYGKIHCYQVLPGKEPELKRVFDQCIDLTEFADYSPNTYISVSIIPTPIYDSQTPGAKIIDRRDELFIQEYPCFCHYSTMDKQKITAIQNMFIVPEDKHIDGAYGLYSTGVIFPPQIELPNVPDDLVLDEAKGARHINSQRWMVREFDDVIVSLNSYDVMFVGSYKRYIKFDLWDKKLKFIKTVLFPIDEFVTFPVIGTELTYIQEKQQIIYSDYVFDLNDGTMNENESFPDKYSFIDQKTVKGKKILIVGAGRSLLIFDTDLKLLASYGIKGKYTRWFYVDDNMYLITSTIIHALDDRGMKPSDKVRMYKISLDV